jgi:hypothetical protein
MRSCHSVPVSFPLGRVLLSKIPGSLKNKNALSPVKNVRKVVIRDIKR